MVIKSDTSNFITPYFLFRFLILHIFVLNTIIPCHFFQFFISCNHEHLYDLTCQKIEAASCVLLFYDSMFTFSAICSLSPTEFIAILGIRFQALLVYSKDRSSYQRCLRRKVFLDILQNSQENTCARVSFLISCRPKAAEHIWATASKKIMLSVKWKMEQPPEVFYKKAILKDLAIFTGKQLYWSFFLIKLQTFVKKRHQPYAPTKAFSSEY